MQAVKEAAATSLHPCVPYVGGIDCSGGEMTPFPPHLVLDVGTDACSQQLLNYLSVALCGRFVQHG